MIGEYRWHLLINHVWLVSVGLYQCCWYNIHLEKKIISFKTKIDAAVLILKPLQIYLGLDGGKCVWIHGYWILSTG